MKIPRYIVSLGFAGVMAFPASHAADVNIISDILSPAGSADNGIDSATDYDGAGPWPVGTVILSSDNEYILDNPIFVEDGATLVIEPGTRILATYNDNGSDGDPLNNDDADRTNDSFGSIVVARGGTINAAGTKAEPIVMTSIYERDGLDTNGDGVGDGATFPIAGENHGLWGGLVILGNAHVTRFSGGVNSGNGTVEGFAAGGDTRTVYGADLGAGESFDNADNSGVLQYVSIRFGGYEFAPGEEINGLTLGGVGSGTTIDHIEVVSNNDDGFEWFGGTVNASHLAAIFCDDDSFDFDQGFQGTLQNVFAIQTEGSLGAGDKLGEHDSRDDGAENFVPHESVATKPVIFNATYIGSNSDTPVGTAFKLREDFAGQYHNSLFMDVSKGLEIGESTDDGESGDLTTENVATGELRFENISWFNVTTPTANPGNTIAARNGSLTLGEAEFQLFAGDYDGTLDFNGSNKVESALPIIAVDRTFGAGGLNPTLADNSPLWAKNGASLTTLPLAYDTAGDNLDTSSLVELDYRGAFGDENWLEDWSYVAQNNYLAVEPEDRPRQNIVTDIIVAAGGTDGIQAGVDYDGAGPWPAGYVRLSAGENYILDNPIFVEDGATLDIDPGTIILATYNDNGADGDPLNNDDADRTNDSFGSIVVARGGTINAAGTANNPIIMTSIYELDGLDTDGDGVGDGATFPVAGENHGLWGGLVILGKAHVTRFSGGVNSGNGTVEGFAAGGDTRTVYGADLGAGESFDNADNSGVLQYVSIRFGGYEFAPGEEINGLTMGGVGSGTTIDHIEVVSNNDDGFEWFGGTVNASHLAAIFCDDDSFDFDQGFQGTLQYVFAIQTEGSLGAGDKLGEHDSRDDGAENFVPHESVATKPVIFNATYIGSNSDTPVGTAFKLREDFAGQYHNSLFMDVEKGIEIGESTDDGESGDLTTENVATGELRFENISWFNVTTPTANPGNTIAARNGSLTLGDAEFQLFAGDYDGTLDFNGSNKVESALPVRSISRMINSMLLDPTLASNSPLFVSNGATVTSLPLAYDTAGDNLDTSGLEASTFRGAFGDENWLRGWTYLDQEDYLAAAGANDDTDSDGLPDAVENVIGTDPEVANTPSEITAALNQFVAAQRAEAASEATATAEASLIELGAVRAEIDLDDNGRAIIGFDLETSSSLEDGSFTPLMTFDVGLPDGKKFYRFSVAD